ANLYRVFFLSAGRSFNAWSILWYVGSFVGLIAFFFIISFSEWCCKRRLWNRRNTRNAITTPSPNGTNDPAPPAYDLFAPPSYDSIYKDGTDEKPQFDVYVVPISSGEELGTQFCGSLINESRATNTDETTGPPSYSSTADVTSANSEDCGETASTQTDDSLSKNNNKERRTKRRAPQPSSSSVVVSLEDPRDDGGGKTSLQ
ncbi:uncharacterized protein LOC108739881, partial [Agrilus planipennis]|uniref:Uncharacterized protein LOC108739881 n=1 Tax=Agrilus planipennis TaxID=224129 RepID=A0A1W4XAN9_AGRPL